VENDHALELHRHGRGDSQFPRGSAGATGAELSAADHAQRERLQPDHDELVSPAIAMPRLADAGHPSVTGGRAALLKVWLRSVAAAGIRPHVSALVLAYTETDRRGGDYGTNSWSIPSARRRPHRVPYACWRSAARWQLATTHAAGGAPAGGLASGRAGRRTGCCCPGIKPSDLRLFFATEVRGCDRTSRWCCSTRSTSSISFEASEAASAVRAFTVGARGARRCSHHFGKLELALASVGNLYRYRKLVRSSFDHALLAWRWLRSRPAARFRGAGGYAAGLRAAAGAGDAFELE
jgi:hypothetical protein